MKRSEYARMSCCYFFFYGTVAVFGPYFNLYLGMHGLSAQQVGSVLAVIPLMGLLMQPVWGMWNDLFHIEKRTVFVALVVPPLVLWTFPYLHTYAWFLLGTAVLAAFQTAGTPVLDSMTLVRGGMKDYGKVRLFGSLGYALIVAGAGQVYRTHTVAWLPLAATITAILAISALSAYPHPRLVTRSKGTLLGGIRGLLRNRSFVALLVAAFLVSVGQVVNNNFFSLYYHDLHRPMGWLGVILGCGALTELPCFFLSGRLIQRFGAKAVFFFGSGVFTLRWLVLAFAPPTWVIVCAQLFHGLSFGLTFAAGVALAAQSGGQSNGVTAQTLYSAVNTGLAAIFGSLIGGWVLQAFGDASVYRFAFVVSLLGMIGMVILFRLRITRYRLQDSAHAGFNG
ncbi:MFS transporter [Alicyclobacillus herbarius]|uniref:MFS transporter n=1 Tax=Alicyclobacillus herbarius TaxID=122960 RepID=UPI0004128B56|nr:MFS transporter [Alicyclobacillus herbarius]